MNAGEPADDVELVARARGGDHHAFEQLVRRHQAAVHRAALSAVGSAADADDVAQEAFVLAFQRLGSFRGQSAFKTWMLTITWNQAMNHRRRQSRWWKRFVSVDTGGGVIVESLQFASAGGTPEDIAVHGQLRESIAVAIRELPVKLRDALLLAATGEYSYDEMSAMLDAKAGTIKWRVFEARRLVRERIGQ